MKRKFLSIVLLAGFLLCLLLSGCGSAGSDASASKGAYDSTETNSASPGWVDDGTDSGSETSGIPAALQNTKVIFTGSMDLQTQDFETTNNYLSELTERVSGYIESSTQGGEVGYRYAEYTVRVPQAQFASFQQQVGENCHITSQHTDTENITEAYVDTEARLATLQTKHARLLALLEKADTMENIIALETALADTEYQIEQNTGTLRKYDSLVDFSTLHLYLSEVRSLEPVNEQIGFGTEVKNAFTSGTQGLLIFLQVLALGLASSWPFLIILAIVIVIAWRLLRHRTRKTTTWNVPVSQTTDDQDPPAKP